MNGAEAVSYNHLDVFKRQVSEPFITLGAQMPAAIDHAQRQLAAWHIDYDLPAIAKAARSQFAAIFTQASGFVISAGGVVADVAVVFVGGIFFAADPAFYRGGLLRLLPRSVEPLMADTLDDAGRGLGLWLKGQMISSPVSYTHLDVYKRQQFNCVVSSNAAAVHLWQAMGFAIVGRLPLAFRHPALRPVDALVMFSPL